MSVDPRLKLIRFFMTGPGPCPYLPGREERKVFTRLDSRMGVQLNELLSHHGFRRSQSIAYRPSCLGCQSCISVRLVSQKYKVSKSHRRIIAQNSDLSRKLLPPMATEEQYILFQKYIAARHDEGGMADMDEDDFVRMIEDSPVDTQVIEYRTEEDNKLVAFCLTDIMNDGLSMVYSVFDPELKKRSLGKFMIMDHVKISRDHNLDYIYLGYWVDQSNKMAYKAGFQPLQYLSNGQWKDKPELNISSDSDIWGH